MSAKTPAKGHTSKHVHKQVKHHKTKGKHHPAKHHQPAGGKGHSVHTVAHHAHHAKPRGFAVGDFLPVCAFEALAMSLRLAGQRVSEDDLMELWHLAGAREVSIAEALEAAARFGLAAHRPYRIVDGLLGHLDVNLGRARVIQVPHADELLHAGELVIHGGSLILGVDLPGPHAVLATPDGWWSWGELWSPWTTAVSEAWAVSWA